MKAQSISRLGKTLTNKKRRSLLFYLVALVLGMAVPLLAFVSVLVLDLQQDFDAAANRRAKVDARTEAALVSTSLHDMTVTLRLLARSPELQSGDLRGFHDRTKAALSTSAWHLILVDRTGQQLLNTRVSFGTKLGKTANMPAFERAMRSRHVFISNLFYGRVGKQFVFNVVLPLEQANKFGAALILTENVGDVSAAIDAQSRSAAWQGVLVDGQHRVIAAKGSKLSLGSIFTGATVSTFGGEASGSHIFIGQSTVEDTDGWRFIVFEPSSVVKNSLVWTWRGLLIGGLLLTSVGGMAAFVIGRRLHHSVVSVASMATKMGSGEPVARTDFKVRELQVLAAAISEASIIRNEVELRLRVALDEVAHRTRNLVTVIRSIVQQTAKQSAGVSEMQASIDQRLQGLAQSISLMIDGHGGEGVPIRMLVDAQLTAFSQDMYRFQINGDDIKIKPSAIQGIGMILHELGTNAVKYGALSGPTGHVEVSWTRGLADDELPVVVLRWSERVSNPVDLDRRGFGTKLIEGTAASLGGHAERSAADGELAWTIQLKVEG